MLFSLAFTLVGVEVFLRVAGLPDSPIAGWKAKDHPQSEYNQFGFRGRTLEAKDDDFVVVLLGDSFVECVSSPIDKIPERMLESELQERGLPAKVVSLGARGYGQDQQLLALREYFKTNRADMVVLWVIPDNDVWNNLFRTHYGGSPPKPTFQLKGDTLVPPQWEWMKRTEPPGLGWLVRRANFQGYDEEWENHLPPPYQPLDKPPVDNPKMDWQERWDSNPLFHGEEFDTDRNHNLLHLEPRSERIAYGIRLTVKLLSEIQSLCQQNGSDFSIIFTGGNWEAEAYDRPVDDLEWYELNGKYYGYSSVTYWANLSEMYDPFPLMVVPCTVEDWKVSETDLHFNQEANKQLMGDLAEEIKKRKELGDAPLGE